MTPRQFRKAIIQCTVLSEGPLEWDDLSDVARAVVHGDCSGRTEEVEHTILNGKEAAAALIAQGSDFSN